MACSGDIEAAQLAAPSTLFPKPFQVGAVGDGGRAELVINLAIGISSPLPRDRSSREIRLHYVPGGYRYYAFGLYRHDAAQRFYQ